MGPLFIDAFHAISLHTQLRASCLRHEAAQAGLPECCWQMSTERSPRQPQRHFGDAQDESSRMRVLGKMLWLTAVRFKVRSFAPGALRQWGSGSIGQETEPLSLSAISLKPAATPCQSWFRWFGALKRKQCSMTDVSLHINTRSSKITRERADARGTPRCVIEADRPLFYTCSQWPALRI